MIEAAHADLSISAQCRLLSISRSSFYYAPQPESDETLALMRVIDAAFLDTPWYGSRQMVRHLRRQGVNIGRRRVRRLMMKMGLSPIYQRPRTSDPHPQHRIYPYLLRHLAIERPNQVWCADITYSPMRRGFLYLVVIMDWATRKVLAWRLSNTMDVGFCVMALEEALARFAKSLTTRREVTDSYSCDMARLIVWALTLPLVAFAQRCTVQPFSAKVALIQAAIGSCSCLMQVRYTFNLRLATGCQITLDSACLELHTIAALPINVAAVICAFSFAAAMRR
jgi:hypothetical protein